MSKLKLLTPTEENWLTLCSYVGIPAEPGLRLLKVLQLIGMKLPTALEVQSARQSRRPPV